MMGIEGCGMLRSAVHKEGEEERLNLLMPDSHVPAGAKLYEVRSLPARTEGRCGGSWPGGFPLFERNR